MKALDARALRSRNALLEAGIEILLANPKASLSEIALKAGVGRATLYRHFETREQLVIALAQESLEMTDEAMQPIKTMGLQGKPAIEAMFDAIMPLASRYHFLLNLWNIVDDDPVITDIYNRQLNELSLRVEEGKSEGSISSDFTSSWIISLIDSLIFSGWWAMANEGLTSIQASGYAKASLFNGISIKNS